ncbi:hypothetical protein WEI85_36390 [Actinomycetes bacterium KLBMP 9797]
MMRKDWMLVLPLVVGATAGAAGDDLLAPPAAAPTLIVASDTVAGDRTVGDGAVGDGPAGGAAGVLFGAEPDGNDTLVPPPSGADDDRL